MDFPRSILLVLALHLGLLAGYAPAQSPILRTDLYSNSLPPGAEMRLGTVRFRTGSRFAFSPDGRTIVASTHRGIDLYSITFWDAATGRRKQTIETGEHRVINFAWSTRVQTAFTMRGGFNEATQTYFDELKVWDLASGRDRTLFTHIGDRWKVRGVHAQQAPIAFITVNGEAVFWNTNSGKPIARFTGPNSMAAVAITYDGRFACAVDNRDGKRLLLFDRHREGKVRKLPLEIENFYPTPIFSPDGTTIAIGPWKKHPVATIDLTTLKVRQVFPMKHATRADYLEFSADGKRLAGVSPRPYRIHVWDVKTGKQIAQTTSPWANMGWMAFSPNGKRLGYAAGRLNFWDVESDQPVRDNGVGHVVAPGFLAISPNSRWAASAGYNGVIRVWSLETGRQKWRLCHGGSTTEWDDSQACYVCALRFSPDGKTLASASLEKTVRIWDVDTGKEKHGFSVHTREDSIRAWAFQPGTVKAYSWRRPALISWNAKTGGKIKEVLLRPENVPMGNTPMAKAGAKPPAQPNQRRPDLDAEAFSEDGSRLLLAAADQFYLFHGASGKCLRALPILKDEEKQVGEMTISPDNKTAAICWSLHAETVELPDGSVRHIRPNERLVQRIRLSDGRVLNEWRLEGWRAGPLAFSPDNRLLAIGDRDHRQPIRIMDCRTGAEVERFSTGGTWVFSLAFSPDGKRLISGMGDTTLLVWRL